MRARTYSVALGLALLASSATSQADPPTETRTQLTALADQAAAEGRLADAREIWHQLWGIEPTAIRACQIGILSHDLGDYVEGARWLSRCERMLSKPKNRHEQELAETWRAALAHARRKVGMLRIDVPAGTAVTVDGQPVNLDEPVVVQPGPHAVGAQLEAGQAVAHVDVAAGETKSARPEVPATTVGPRLPVVIAGGVTAIGLVAGGIGLHLAAAAAAEERNAALKEARYGCYLAPSEGACSAAVDANSAAGARSDWGTALLIAGGIAAGATATYAVWPRGREVTIAIAGPGVAMSGTW